MSSDWGYSRYDRGWSLAAAGTGMLRVALLFGSVAIAMGLLFVPILERQWSQPEGAGVDMMSMASVRAMQASAPCIVKTDGALSGSC